MFKDPQQLPQKFRDYGIYYGWIVLAAGTIGVIMSIPGQTMGISVFTEHLLSSLNLDRLTLSFSYLAGTLTSAFLLPFAGRILDGHGSRFMGVLSALCLGFFLCFMAQSPTLTRELSILTSLSPKWSAFIITFFGFLGIRHFGQGQLTMASRTMMGRWFEKKRGLVLGLSGVFVAFGFGVAPLVLTSLILQLNWQNSLYVLGFLSLLMSAFAWLTFRHSPEQCGLAIDGGKTSAAEKKIEDPLECSFTSKEALKTFSFWSFNFGMVAQAMLLTAVTFHMARIGELQGLSTTKAFSLYLPVAIVSIFADLIGGHMSDRFPIKYLLTVMQAALCTGLLGLQYLNTATGFAVTAVSFGISNGLFSLLMGAAWPKLFGRKHLGSIAGINMAWIVGGSALGPYLFSLGESLTGSFHEVILISIIFPFLVAVTSLFVRPPVKSEND